MLHTGPPMAAQARTSLLRRATALTSAIIFLLPALALAQGPPPPVEPREEPEKPSSGEPEGEEEAPSEEAGAPEEPPAPETRLPGDEVDEDEPEPPLIPPAPNTLAGHVLVSGSAALVAPFGSFQEGISQTSAVGTGLGFQIDVGVGISRTVELGVWGQTLNLGDGNDCADCSLTSHAFGAFVRYHLVQGVRFDPWMSAGIGYRLATVSGLPGGDIDYSGIEWLRLQVGGDWYPFRVAGLGPFFELDMGIYGNRSPGSLGDASAHWQFLSGLRVTLDVPGK
jgi:hypothetical protein